MRIHSRTGTTRLDRPRRAQAFVEFGITILFLIGVLVAIFEGARWLSTYFMLANAAAEGARAGAFVPRTPQWPQDDIDTKITAATNRVLAEWIDLTDTNITICRVEPTTATTACTADSSVSPILSGDDIIVKITYTFRWLPFAAGWLGQSSDTITVSHRERIE
jgi:Flp pilus assembly protein TadG